MAQQLTLKSLGSILQAEEIESLSFEQLTSLFFNEEAISVFRPDGIYQVDPRNGDRIIFNSPRARRPHDNRFLENETDIVEVDRECAICQGNTTGVVDLALLSEGFTFVNMNLFPVLYPTTNIHKYPVDYIDRSTGVEGGSAHGYHLLQWTSSLHNKDWHNLPRDDRVMVMKRLAALEEWFLTGFQEFRLISGGDINRSEGYVSIIKNYGHLVGGSLAHGHQQIVFSNVMPRRVQNNLCFEQDRGETFSAYLLRENPEELLVCDYGLAVLLVPYMMRRPFDMYLILKDTKKRYIHELSEVEIEAVVDGWQDAIKVIREVMPRIGREVAYNVTTNNGPGAGLYFEFLPYTQEMGGYEHLGLIICQGNPQDSAARIREILSDL